MLNNYFLLYFRNLRKEKLRILNIFSIAFALAFAMLILFFVLDELSYDRWNENRSKVYRVTSYEKWPAKIFNTATSTVCTGPTLKSEFPEIKSFVRFLKIRNPKVTINKKEFNEEKFFYSDSTLFKIFPYELKAGSQERALSEPNSIVLTEELATKYFDKENALGKTIKMNDVDYTVKGIIAGNYKSHLQFKAILSMLPYSQEEDHHSSFNSETIAQCGGKDAYTYILIHENTEIGQLSKKLPAFYEKYMNLEEGFEYNLVFESLSNTHFSDKKLESDLPTMNIKYIYICVAMLLIVLIFSIINYVNLVVGKSIKTGRFIGLNKMYGINKRGIFTYFISDSLLNAIIATLFSLLILLLILPRFNEYFNKDLVLNVFANKHVLKYLVTLWTVIGVLPGCILALIFIPIKPLFIIKNQLVRRNRFIRKVFMFLEIALLTIVVLGIIIVNFQLYNLKNRDLGFNKENIILIQIKNPDLIKKSSLFKDAILKYPDVLEVTVSDISVGDSYWVSTFHAKIDDQLKSYDLKSMIVDESFIDLYQLEILEGRSFDKDNNRDFNNCLINEAALSKLGFVSEFLDMRIRFRNRDEGVIIGVVKNFYFTSKHNEIEPLFIYLADEGGYNGTVSVKFASNSLKRTLKNLNNEWSSFSPNADFNYTLAKEKIEAFYSSEEKLNVVLKWGTILSFFIVSFGLICFVLFIIEQRIKEISIRKVNGATTFQIIRIIIINEFLFPSVAAIVLMLPLNLIVLRGLRQSFVMDYNVNWWIYIATSIVIIIFLILITFYHLFKAANMNPVEALNSE
jgi:putative ABC transport system permease protein